jgi:hypothetical protein
MNHDVAEVHENPFCRGCAFHTERLMALRGEGSVDAVRDRADLPFRFTGTDDEVIGDRGQCGDMQDEDIGGFLIQRCPCDNQCFSF